MKCQKCSKQNRKGVAFCEYCGAKLISKKSSQTTQKKTSASKTKKCPKCGAFNRAAVFFCEDCGTSLEGVKAAPKITAKRLPAGVCSQCGKKNRIGVAFCEYCGHPLGVPAKKKIFAPLAAFTQKLRGAINANPYRVAFYGLASICVILLAFTVFNSLFYSVTKSEARKIAQVTMQSLYPELQGVKPYIDSYSQNDQKYTSFTYTKNFSGQTADGVQVEFSAGVVININRTSGEFEIMHIQ